MSKRLKKSRLSKLFRPFYTPLLHTNILTGVMSRHLPGIQPLLLEDSKTYKTLFENAGEALLCLQGRTILACNQAALDLFGCRAKEDMVGNDISRFTPATQPDGTDSIHEVEMINRDVERGLPQTFEWQHKRLDGILFSAEVNLDRVMIEDSIYFIAVVRDISSWKKKEELLKDSLSRKDDFIANFSHELRTALFSILGFTTIIKKEEHTLEREKMAEFLSIIHLESLKLSSLVEDVLSISRINSGKGSFKKRVIDLEVVLDEIMGSLQISADEKRIQLSMNAGEQGASILADPDAIRQMFTNLVNNAVKFTPAGGRVTITMSVDREVSKVIVTVTDTGIGIPAAEIPNIFERFYRVRRDGLDFEGSGLGLAIVEKNLRLHDGTIDVESREGEGTTMRVTLPLAST